jgi:hypothetical protein
VKNPYVPCVLQLAKCKKNILGELEICPAFDRIDYYISRRTTTTISD